MRSRVLGAAVLIVAIAVSTTGCMQFGEYAMSAECEDFAAQVVTVVEDAYGGKPQVENLWAGEAAIWCRFDLETGADLRADDSARISVREAVQELLQDTFSSDVAVNLVYATDQDSVSI